MIRTISQLQVNYKADDYIPFILKKTDGLSKQQVEPSASILFSQAGDFHLGWRFSTRRNADRAGYRRRKQTSAYPAPA